VLQAGWSTKRTVVIREKSSLGELAIISDSPTVPRGSGRWSLRVPVIRKREQELDPVLLSGGNDLVESLETICTCVNSCLAVL
jgi:hypothetical protein